MSYQTGIFRKELIICFCIFIACFLSVVIAGLLIKLFFSIILWALDSEFGLSWYEVLRGIKIGGVGGSILGGGMILFRLLKVKGF